MLTKPHEEPQNVVVRGVERRCPHVVLPHFLGAVAVEQLLSYVGEHRSAFEPAKVYNSGTRIERLNVEARNCLRLPDIGPFRPLLKNAVNTILPKAVSALGILVPHAKAREFEFCAYGDGGFFEEHKDTLATGPRRVLSCVYYFFREPARFSGGELRLHAWPSRDADPSKPAPTIDIAPECDTVAIFSSALRHEVRRVTCPSNDWHDFRFTINCWAYMPSPSAGEQRPPSR